LGAEKFFNIKCRKAGLQPDLTVIVVTSQGLKMHGGVALTDIKKPNPQGLARGLENLDKHIANIQSFGQKMVVTFNRHDFDSDEEIALVQAHCLEKGVGFAVNSAFRDGGAGAVELAALVAETIEKTPSAPLRFTYEEQDTVKSKIMKIARNIYGAGEIQFSDTAEKMLKHIRQMNIEHFPVCMAKTQFSFSADPKAYGVEKDFELKINDIVINNGAQFIVAIAGEIMRMPGLPKQPNAWNMDIVAGKITGLS
jgi:formate--tetrahydrofolate ligase